MDRIPANTLTSPCRKFPFDDTTGIGSATVHGHGHSAVQMLLEEAFDPAWDRIVSETGRSSGHAARQVAGGLSVALGFLGARQRLGEDRWVVYLAGRSSLASIVAQLDRWSAFGLDRFLIIVPTTHLTADAADALGDIQRRGLAVLDLTAARDPLELGAALQRVRDDNTGCVALLDPEICNDGGGDSSPGTTSTEPRANAASADPVIDTLVAAVRRDPRITPVLMVQDERWSRLADELPASLLRVAPQDIDEAIPWCLALAQGGCQPVLIMNGRQVEHRRRLTDQLRGDPQPIAIIVDDRDSCCEQLFELVDCGPAAHDGLQLMPGLSWTCPGRLDEAAAMLSEALQERTSLALQLRPGIADAVRRETPRSTGFSPTDQTAIADKTLGPDILPWVDEYEGLGHRGRYLWRWCLHGLELTTLSCVPRAERRHVCDTKLLAVMYGVLLDDVADREHDGNLLRRLTAATLDGGGRDFDGLSADHRRYADFTCRVWDCYLARIRRYPRYADFAGILEYDSRRVVNTMGYALLVNTDVRVMNRVEHDLYTPHNMQMMTFAMVDLMASPGFDVAELGRLRHAIWHAQCMGRIGNLVSTWERELDEGDFSSGVFTRLLDAGYLNAAALPDADGEMIRNAVKSRRIESSFLDEWMQHRRELRAMVPEVGSVDLNEIVMALERLIRMELFSRGLK